MDDSTIKEKIELAKKGRFVPKETLLNAILLERLVKEHRWVLQGPDNELIKERYGSSALKLHDAVEELKERGVITVNTPDYYFSLDKLGELKRLYAKVISILEKLDGISDFKGQITFLEQTLHTNALTPVVRKGSYIGNKFYSLWIANSPVFLYQDNGVFSLKTCRKDKPLELIASGSVPPVTERLGLLNDGNFYNSDGHPLYGTAEEIAADIFLQVMNGKEILPAPQQAEGYIVKTEKRKKNDLADRYRHWGQIFLGQLEPDEVVDGQILGSGGSYKAFVFRKKTVVEFDQEDHATYLFDTDFFNSLRHWNRQRILDQNPAGFQGRIIHEGSRSVWKTSVTDYLNKP
ncbi:hypothetical protein KY331_05960 [Candidatus Woesearchaeota archaeon]|nr:hypothetical protein [Candidatus Woesearchaeota archaeon]